MKYYQAVRFSQVVDTSFQKVCFSWDEAILSLSLDSLHTKKVWPHAYIAEEDTIKWAVKGTDAVLGMSIQFANDFFQQNKLLEDSDEEYYED